MADDGEDSIVSVLRTIELQLADASFACLLNLITGVIATSIETRRLGITSSLGDHRLEICTIRSAVYSG